MTTTSIGGTTGLDHSDNSAIEEAGRWLASTPPAQRPRPIVPALRQRFGLSAPEACEAIRQAILMEARAN